MMSLFMRIQKLTIPVIILAATAANVSSFIIGRLKSPQWMEFLGAVHYPTDYFYYLSLIAQGEYRWLTAVSLHTTETLPPTIIGWFYVVLGRIGYFLHLRPDFTYQLGVIGCSVLYITAAYYLIRLVFPTSKTQQTVSLVLFLTANAFPLVFRSESGLTLDIVRPWFSYGNPFTRLTNVPSHLAIQALLLSSVSIASVWYVRGAKSRNALGTPTVFILRTLVPWSILFFVFGLIVSSLQPVQWLIVSAAIGLGYGALVLKERVWKKPEMLVITLVPLAFYGIGGAISAYILSSLKVTYPPMAAAAAWEAGQQQYYTYIDFLKSNGPVWIIGLLGLPFFLKSLSTQRTILVVYTVLSISLFFSTLPQRLGIMNIRVLSTLPTLTMALSATGLLWKAATLFPKHRTLIMWLSVLAVTLPTLYTTWLQARERTSFDINNAYYYLPKDTLQVFAEAKRMSTPDDTFLVGWPFNEPFPAFTGRREYISNFLATLDIDRKNKLAYTFFDNRMTEEEMEQFLRENSIRFLVVYPIPHIVNHPNIKTRATSSNVYLFEYTGLDQ